MKTKITILFLIICFQLSGQNFFWSHNAGSNLSIVTTLAVTGITTTTATGGGNVITDGGSAITNRGVCWSTSLNPTTANPKTTDGTGIGSYESFITGLVSGTTYYVRAYATNSTGTGYGANMSFTTSHCPNIGDSYGGGIVFYILKSSDQGYLSNKCQGLIASLADQSRSYAYSPQSLFCSNTWEIGSGNSNTNNIVTANSGLNTSALLCADLIENGFSDWYLPSKAELRELYIQRNIVGGFTNKLYWSSTEQTNSTVYGMCFGDINSTYVSGSVWATNKPSPSAVRAIRSFVTDPIATIPIEPTVITGNLSAITTNSATLGGNVTLAGTPADVTERGICYSTSANPTISSTKVASGSGTGTFTTTITSLTEGVVYYAKAYATNPTGTAYGSQVSFMVLSSANYGKLYNWYAVTDARNISNTGWHVPSFDELVTLRSTLDPSGGGGTNVAGDMMREVGVTHWLSPNANATNSVGWNGLGSGIRYANGSFTQILQTEYYATTSTMSAPNSAYSLGGDIGYSYSRFRTDPYTIWVKTIGRSVRLICDSQIDPLFYTGNDGKNYGTVKIGNQIWLSSNLSETLYRDKSPIPNVVPDASWSVLTTGAWCFYNNNPLTE